MTDNSKKLDELESKMNILEATLAEIKAAIKEKRGSEGPIDNESTVYNEPTVDEREARLPQDEQEKIHYILRNFNFEKVHDIMKSLGWNWAFCKEGTPTVEELKSEAHRLLVDACEEKTYISTGGFRAVYEKETWDDPNDHYIGLEFIVEECEGFADGDE